MRRLDVRDPVANRLAGRFLQRLSSELDGADLGAQQAHSLDVRPLALHVLGAHVDDARHPEARAHGGRGDAVLARARLRDDALLAEAAGDQRLTDRVVDLVRARVAEVLALQIDAAPVADARGQVERRRPAHIRAVKLRELGGVGRVAADLFPAALELLEGGHESLGDVLASVQPVLGDAHARAPRLCARAASTNVRIRE